MVIEPLLSYCSLLKPTLMQTQLNKILSFEKRTKEMIGCKQYWKKQVNLVSIKKKTLLICAKSSHGRSWWSIQKLFWVFNTIVNTRNKTILLHLLKLVMVASQQSILEQKHLMTCQLKFVNIAKKIILIVFKKIIFKVKFILILHKHFMLLCLPFYLCIYAVKCFTIFDFYWS